MVIVCNWGCELVTFIIVHDKLGAEVINMEITNNHHYEHTKGKMSSNSDELKLYSSHGREYGFCSNYGIFLILN